MQEDRGQQLSLHTFLSVSVFLRDAILLSSPNWVLAAGTSSILDLLACLLSLISPNLPSFPRLSEGLCLSASFCPPSMLFADSHPLHSCFFLSYSLLRLSTTSFGELGGVPALFCCLKKEGGKDGGAREEKGSHRGEVPENKSLV